VNIALGSATSTIGMTIPTALVIAYITGQVVAPSSHPTPWCHHLITSHGVISSHHIIISSSDLLHRVA
jgi:Ca2+/H+ antiporter